MKFTIIKSCLARFSGIFALGTPSNIHGTAIRYRCAKFGAFVNSVTILTLRDLTKEKNNLFFASPSLTLRTRFALQEKCRVRLAWLIKHLLYGLTKTAMVRRLENQGPRFGKLHRCQKAKR